MRLGKLCFEPEKWHACSEDDWKDCIEGVNCYSYALNTPEFHWSVPGLGFARIRARLYIKMFNGFFKNTTLSVFRERLIRGAVADGLVHVNEQTERKGYYLVALFF